jgi:hypothetical protein
VQHFETGVAVLTWSGLENGRLKKQLEQLKEKMAKAKEDEEAFVKHMSDSIQFDPALSVLMVIVGALWI